MNDVTDRDLCTPTSSPRSKQQRVVVINMNKKRRTHGRPDNAMPQQERGLASPPSLLLSLGGPRGEEEEDSSVAATTAPRSSSSASPSFRRHRWRLIPLVAVTALNLASNLKVSSGSVVIAPRNCGGAVKHVTIAVGPDPSTSMIVTFASIPSTFEAPVGGVLVGTSPSQLDQLALEDGPPTHYSVKSAHHGSKDPYHSPYYHHVTVTGLEPNTNYYYKPVVQANVKAFDKYNLLLRKTAAPSPPASPAAAPEGDGGGTTTNPNANTDDDDDDLLRDFENAVQDDAMDASHRRFLMENGPYDGSAKQCPSADKIRSFKTAPVAGADTIVNLAICGDIGQFPHSEELVSRMLRSRDGIDALILAGDIAYASLDQRRWDTFLDFLDDYPIADTVPMMIVPGNHDIEKQEDGVDMFQAYENRFRMPRVHPPIQKPWDGPSGPFNMDHPPYPLGYEWGNAYYAFTYGPARVIMISAYSSMEVNSTQYEWIVSELNAVDRSVTPWVLAVLHPPMYNTFSLHQRDPQIIAAKTNLEPLFVEHRVNMIFTGHVHAYMRTTTVAHDVIDPKGPMHVTVGAGGRKCEAPFKNEEPEPWVEVRDATVYGYGMFRIVNRTHAEWDWVHTGHNDNREYNQLYHSNVTLPAGPGRDRVVLTNQYFL